MARFCTICSHHSVDDINAAIVEHEQGLRAVASRYDVSRASLQRHARTHLRDLIQQSEELKMLASTESLIAELNRLHAYVSDVLERGRAASDDRLILLAVKEGRGDVESLAKLSPLRDVEERLARLEAQTRPMPPADADADAATDADVGAEDQ